LFIRLAGYGHHLGTAGQFIPYPGLGIKTPQALFGRTDLELQNQLIAGHDASFETSLVNSGKVDDGAAFSIHGPHAKNEPRLSQSFQNQNARHHGMSREMARKERLVEGYILERSNRFSGLAIQYPVHQQERIPMW